MKEKEKLIPQIMIYYPDSLVKSNTDWELAMREVIKEKKKE